MFARKNKTSLPSAAESLPGRDTPMPVPDAHFVNGHALQPPFPEHLEQIVLGMGCFWGAERIFWELPGVHVTAVGYAGGNTPNPNYREVCSGQTGHSEVVLVVFDPKKVSLDDVFRQFWEAHDPTQGMRQGNDLGSQYRSAIYSCDTAQLDAAMHSAKVYQQELAAASLGKITTEISPLARFYYAEDYHQQYLAKNPGGYCGIGGTGISCPIGAHASA